LIYKPFEIVQVLNHILPIIILELHQPSYEQGIVAQLLPFGLMTQVLYKVRMICQNLTDA